MREYLQKIRSTVNLIGIRTAAQEIDEIVIGKIIDIKKDIIIIEEIDEFGDIIGRTTFKLDEIINVEFNDLYQKKLSELLNSDIVNESKYQVSIWNEGNNLKEDITRLIESQEFVTLFFNEDYYVTGRITEQPGNILIINNFTDNGENDGFSFHFLDKLIGIRYKGKVEIKIKLLSELGNDTKV